MTIQWKNGVFFGRLRNLLPNGYGKWTVIDGKLIAEGKWKDGIKDGITKEDNYGCCQLYETKEGKCDGKYLLTHRDGSYEERSFQGGILSDESRYYSQDSSFMSVETYQQGRIQRIASKEVIAEGAKSTT